MGKFFQMATFRSSSRKDKNINKNWLSNIELVLTHTISELGVDSIAKKFSVSFIDILRYKIFSLQAEKTQSTIIWLIGILGIKLLRISSCN